MEINLLYLLGENREQIGVSKSPIRNRFRLKSG